MQIIVTVTYAKNTYFCFVFPVLTNTYVASQNVLLFVCLVFAFNVAHDKFGVGEFNNVLCLFFGTSHFSPVFMLPGILG